MMPSALADDLGRARRLAWWTLAWMATVLLVIGATTGSSQAMKAAWLEDLLSLVPAIVFLVALRYESRPATPKFPFGFQRVNSLAFMIAAVALSFMGGYLLFDSVSTLLSGEHVTIMPVRLFGHTVWMGWIMIAALLYSVIPPVLLARQKLPVARRLQDKVLHTDAMMQKADWLTGLAGVAGVVGVGLGFWWADAAAAGAISFSILQDGIRALRTASAELIDGAPRALDSSEIADDVGRLREALVRQFPGAEVRARETGRFIRAELTGIAPPSDVDLGRLWPGKPERAWRVAEISFVPPGGERAPVTEPD